MTIASEIQRIGVNISNAYDACESKGATLPASKTSANLASTISAIPAGTTPTLASLTITPSTTAQTLTPPSGTDGYNTVIASAVTASIDNNITAGNIKKNVSILGVTGTYEGSGGVALSNIKNYAISTDNSIVKILDNSHQEIPVDYNTNPCAYNLYRAYYSAPYKNSIKSFVFKNFVQFDSMSSTFRETFRGNTALTSVDLSKLTTIKSNGNYFNATFYGSGVKEVLFTRLSDIDDTGSTARGDFTNTFYNCTGAHIYFNALNTFSFNGGYNATFVNLLKNATNCTVHFPSNLANNTGIDMTYDYMTDEYVSNGTWVTNCNAGFGGTNTTVLFDLPATT